MVRALTIGSNHISIGDGTEANSNRLDTRSNLDFHNASPAGDVENSPQSAVDKPSFNTANQLTNTNSDESVANNNDASLIDTVFEDSGSILDDTLSNTSSATVGAASGATSKMFYSGLDLFNSPLASSNIADTVSQFTLSFIADGTLPFEVPQFTPDTTTPNSVQYLPNTSALRVKQLREGLRHHHHSAVVSTYGVRQDGTPEFVESENIPRQLKHVILPRGPPRRQPDTVLRIMDSDQRTVFRIRSL